MRSTFSSSTSATAIAPRAGFLFSASVLLSWVAVVNGAPLVFSDTISYATAAYEREVHGLFSIFYSAFMLPLHGGVSFWPVVFVQGAILAHLLYLVARATTQGKIGKTDMIVILSALAVFSSLPWITGQLLPDTFTPVVLLGFFLLAFAHDKLGSIELVYVAALTTFAIASHLSHVPIAAGLLLLCTGLGLLGLGPPKQTRWRMTLLTFPLIFAAASLVAVNGISSQSFVLARNGNVFLLAKWIDEGPALAYLKRACPSAEYTLCQHLPELEGKSHDDLKWGANSPFQKVGTFDDLEPEARAIVQATLLSHPFEITRHALVDAGLQFTRFQAGDGLTSEFARWVGDRVANVYGPEVGKPFLESKQASGELPVAQIRYLHLIALTVALGFCLWCWPRLSSELSLLFVFVFAAIVWSAVVTGALSGPYDRYLARVIWLVCFVALLGLFHLLRRQPAPSSEPKP